MDVSKRVADRFHRTVVAETLTKSWLMGVRRGFLSLLKPVIRDYDDVFAALKKLERFVDNLKDQVTYVRRGPLSGLADSDESRKLAEAFTAITKVLEDAESAARHWKECYDGTDLNARQGWGSCRDDGEKMLETYRTKFQDALQGHVKTRGKYRQERSADITEFLDRILKILYADAKAIQEHRKVDPEPMAVEEGVFTEFTVGKMKVVIVDPKIRPTRIRQYVRDVDKAYALLQRAKFADKVWYGVLFIVADQAYVLPEHERYAYNVYGYDIDSKSGDYSWHSDAVRIWDSPPITGVLLHELGHRHWYKGMTQSQRGKFTDIIRVKEKRPTLPGLLLESTLTECKRDADVATKEFKSALQRLRKPPTRSKKYRKLLEAFQPEIQAASKQWSDAIVIALGKLAAYPDARAQWDDVLRTTSEVTKRALFADEDINSMMMRTPEPTSPIPDLDQYWLNIYREQQGLWLEQLVALADQGHTEAFVYLDAAFVEHNERVTRESERALAEYEALVPPVSGYGETNASEAFAEAFKHYCMGRDMTRDQIESFKAVLRKAAVQDKQRVLKIVTSTLEANKHKWDWVEGFTDQQLQKLAVNVAANIDKELKKLSRRGLPPFTDETIASFVANLSRGHAGFIAGT